ncbi:MAG: hypothetical protein HC896_14655 [Bacteroidales bacterium]|nr:hypothetical protein [Bacteroidales bacterium]
MNTAKRNLHKKEYEGEIASNLLLLKNEVAHENLSNKQVLFKAPERINSNNLTKELLNELSLYIEEQKVYYRKLYNRANALKDKEISKHQQTHEAKEAFLDLKRKHHNENLADFVENKNEVVRIVEYKNKLYQKADPIYLDPEHFLVKSHFYAPQKRSLADT